MHCATLAMAARTAAAAVVAPRYLILESSCASDGRGTRCASSTAKSYSSRFPANRRMLQDQLRVQEEC